MEASAATFFFPILLAVYWPRMNKAGCLAGLLGGFVSFVLQYLSFGPRSFGGFDPFVWSLLISLAFTLMGTKLSAAPPRELTERYFGGEST
jgi:sodium/pantothenate symporter